MEKTIDTDHEESTVNLKNPVWFREWFKIIIRQWAGELKPNELVVVLFIFDRTAAWGKEWEFIKSEAFVEGVTSKDGSIRYANGVCSSLSVARKITADLTKRGYLRRRRFKYGYQWSINYDHHVSTGEQSELSSQELSPVSSLILRTKENKQMLRRKLSSPSRPRGSDKRASSVEEALEKGRAKAKKARERQELRKKYHMNSSDIRQRWTTLVQNSDWVDREDIASSKLYLTGIESKALASYCKRFLKNYPSKPFADYLAWVIDNWQGIRTEVFGWMTKKPSPEAPHAMFLIKWADRFEERYLQGLAFEHRLEHQEPSTSDKKRPTKKVRRVSKKTRLVRPSSKHDKQLTLPQMDSSIADEYDN